MKHDIYTDGDYGWIQELLDYPEKLKSHLSFFETTAQIMVPDDPIERVVFQDRAKSAIRKIAQNRGHILMVGRPGTGKSLLANMFKEVLDRSLGDHLRPAQSIIAYPGKDKHHIRIAYESPEKADQYMANLTKDIQTACENTPQFNLSESIGSMQRAKFRFTVAAVASAGVGLVFPPAFAAAGLMGIGAIFMLIQENQYKVQEKIQRESGGGRQRDVKMLMDMVPEVLFDPPQRERVNGPGGAAGYLQYERRLSPRSLSERPLAYTGA